MTGSLPPALLLAAPTSGSGKTTLTLSLLAALRATGLVVRAAKCGPDYIDPRFHEAASGAPSVNLDPFAMTPETLRQVAAAQASGADLLLIEAAMGLFDGAADGKSSAADVAAALGVPVILVVDCGRQAQSVAALVRGFRDHRADVRVAGVILNRIGSARHADLLTSALAPLGMPVLGLMPRKAALALPERHLGLVQAEETADLAGFLAGAAEAARTAVDLAALVALAGPLAGAAAQPAPVLLPPPGQRVAIARDVAFSFAYPHLLAGWQAAGAEILPFSPLADEGPDPAADAVYLPGGYPELHAGRLATNAGFRSGMKRAVAAGRPVFGECGGYMVLGEVLVDAEGASHAMLGLLPLRTSFAARRLHLGYRRLTARADLPFAGLHRGTELAAHEFHYATIQHEGAADRLFAACDPAGAPLPDMGLVRGRVMGSFAHLISA
ncbi:cobyrinate a,c-diamide synthase [Microvirga tunisiensis]|uniref:Hydrogenobyrinate a,c-diamide synthase n=1 Tax=Pannonibacter tanglangensis TaxID=2750084 RepID=A0A7X5J934_9HYPH|nr:cobyrinate a,c-diamide synthase [Pannonibacter sp. XCT-53]NBN79394.1 cobyrinate a,c-diamide synthase [Pannonibacter sp. XCT-53]